MHLLHFTCLHICVYQLVCVRGHTLPCSGSQTNNSLGLCRLATTIPSPLAYTHKCIDHVYIIYNIILFASDLRCDHSSTPVYNDLWLQSLKRNHWVMRNDNSKTSNSRSFHASGMLWASPANDPARTAQVCHPACGTSPGKASNERLSRLEGLTDQLCMPIVLPFTRRQIGRQTPLVLHILPLLHGWLMPCQTVVKQRLQPANTESCFCETTFSRLVPRNGYDE